MTKQTPLGPTTTFADLATGDKFVHPGKATVYVKVNSQWARAVATLAEVRMSSTAAVVPETTATVADILGSWSALGRR